MSEQVPAQPAAEAIRYPGEEPTGNSFVMSLADALTCVFGAAIALFVIFLVLVKLDPSVTRNEASDKTETVAFGDGSFDGAFDGGLSVTLIFAARDCREISGIRVGAGAPEDVRHWISPQGPGHAARKCRFFVHMPSGFSASAIEFTARRPARNVAMRVLVGNLYSETIKFDIPFSPGQGTESFASLRQSGEFRLSAGN